MMQKQTAAPQPKPDYLAKLLILGDARSGKTSIRRQFCENKFSESYATTIGCEFCTRSFNIENKITKLQIWDLAGQERFRSLTRIYYRQTKGAMIVYDVTDRSSFEKVERFIKELRSEAGQDVPIVLVGNKIDLERKRVPTAEAQKLASKYQKVFQMEVSAKTRQNLDRTFLVAAYEMTRYIDRTDPSLQRRSGMPPLRKDNSTYLSRVWKAT